jgi:hypothetical protein
VRRRFRARIPGLNPCVPSLAVGPCVKPTREVACGLSGEGDEAANEEVRSGEIKIASREGRFWETACGARLKRQFATEAYSRRRTGERRRERIQRLDDEIEGYPRTLGFTDAEIKAGVKFRPLD